MTDHKCVPVLIDYSSTLMMVSDFPWSGLIIVVTPPPPPHSIKTDKDSVPPSLNY